MPFRRRRSMGCSAGTQYIRRTSIGDQNLVSSSFGWNGFKITLAALKESSAAFPRLRIALEELTRAIEIVDRVSVDQEIFQPMIQRINRLSEVLKKYSLSPPPGHVTAAVDGFSQNVERRRKFIHERLGGCVVGHVLNASDNANEIINTLREFTFAVELISTQTGATRSQALQTMEFIRETRESVFERLDAAAGASYDQSHHTGCIDGTRVDSLMRLLAWADDPYSCPILWLSGSPGFGKSATAYSFCEVIGNGHLGASFFCSRGSQNLNNVNRILPTVAYQLAHRLPAYREALVEVLECTSRISYASSSLQEQVTHLFIDLKEKLETNVSLTIVIDALGECTRPSDALDFLRVISRADLPLKFLITSRLQVDKSFPPQQKFPFDRLSLRLEDLERDSVEDDIIRYLSRELSSVLDLIYREKAPAKIKLLGKICRGLFISAFTLAKYITPPTNSPLAFDVRERLSSLFQSLEGRLYRSATGILDDIYAQVLASACKGKGSLELSNLRVPLDMLVNVRVPQSVSVISGLLSMRQVDVRMHLWNFYPVLNIPDNDHDPIIIHTSFSEYIADDLRSGIYKIEERDQHQRLASACLKLMNTCLHEDMCGIKRRETRNADVGMSFIREQISPALRYASIYWASHLSAGLHSDPSVFDALKVFVEVHLLHWLECLSLIQKLDVAYDCIEKACLYLMHNNALVGAGSQEMWGILLDAQFMIPKIHYFIRLHALEVYVSALMWLPRMSMLRAKYMGGGVPRVIRGLDRHWDMCMRLLQSTHDVPCLGFSPGGVILACGTGTTVQIWSLEIGQLVMSLTGHADYITSVAFSPDGSKLASGSDDGTARIWNSSTGELMMKLSGHMSVVTAVAFCPNGSKLVSGSDDRTIQIWNVNTGEPVLKPLSHIKGVTCAVFSPDGSKLASGSCDETVRVWDAHTGRPIMKLTGHTSQVASVAFSFDGHKLASGSDDRTVRVWNAWSGEPILKPLIHASKVSSIAFSPNGPQLASGSDDRTLHIWNTDTGELVLKLSGHTRQVTCVAFSPDGSKLASGSRDETVRVWNAYSSNYTQDLIRHTGIITSVTFSPDKSKLVSGSDDGTVCIWDTNTGELVSKLSGHTSEIISFTFSHDTSKFASISQDGTVQIWSADSGELLQILPVHTSDVTFVAFSPDGNKFASSPHSQNVRLWDTDTGKLIQELSGHDGVVTTIAFSPDGSGLVSGSDDRTARIWNSETGKTLLVLCGHTGSIRSVAYSPDGFKLASGSDDRTVSIWHIGAGELVGRLSGLTHRITYVAFSPDGLKLVSGWGDRKLSVWNAENGELLDESEDGWGLPTWSARHGLLFWAIQKPARDQCCIVSRNSRMDVQSRLWIWGSNLGRRISSSQFCEEKASIGYATGDIVILELDPFK